MQVVVTEVVRGSAGREPPVAGEMENSRRKGERYQGDRVTARMIGCMCNGKTGGRKEAVRFLTWASGWNNGAVHGDGCWERLVEEGGHSLNMEVMEQLLRRQP